MKRLLVFGLCWVISLSVARAQFGARAAGLGGAAVALDGDAWAAAANPANLARLEGAALGFYAEQRFALSELTYGTAVGAMPFLRNRHHLGIALNSEGFAAFRANQFSASYATTLLERIDLGFRLRYVSLNIRDAENAGAAVADLGLGFELTPEIRLAALATNVNRAQWQIPTGDEALATRLAVGVQYRPSEPVILVGELSKDVDHPASFRGGIEYEIGDKLVLRGGIGTTPVQWTTGVGIQVGELDVNLAFGYTAQLGYTPAVGLHYGGE